MNPTWYETSYSRYSKIYFGIAWNNESFEEVNWVVSMIYGGGGGGVLRAQLIE